MKKMLKLQKTENDKLFIVSVAEGTWILLSITVMNCILIIIYHFECNYVYVYMVMLRQVI